MWRKFTAILGVALFLAGCPSTNGPLPEGGVKEGEPDRPLTEDPLAPGLITDDNWKEKLGNNSVYEAGIRVFREQGELRVEIPLKVLTGNGTLDLSVRNLQGEELAETTATVDGDGAQVIEATLPDPLEGLGQAEAALVVIRYELRSLGAIRASGFRSLWTALAKEHLFVSAPPRVAGGGTARVSALVYDDAGEGVADRKVEIVATIGEDVHEYVATTSAEGKALLDVDLPPGGTAQLEVAAPGVNSSPLTAYVEAPSGYKVLLTTDKPMYQPGQTMHLRSLALDTYSLGPAQEAECLFEVWDGKNNKVLKKGVEVNEYGVASTTFKLASEVNEGPYRLKVTVGDNETEKSVKVSRYALPKFKLDVDLDRPYYLAGQTVSGTVKADYFFGKPVAQGEININLLGYSVEFDLLATAQVTTNDEGVASFAFDLPGYLVGQPLENGNALMFLELEAEDSGGHKEKKYVQFIVAKDPLRVTVVPENGKPVAGMKNLFYVFTTNPVGQPVAADYEVVLLNSTEWGSGTVAGTLEGPFATSEHGTGAFEVTWHGDYWGVRITASTDIGGQAVTFSEDINFAHAGLALITDKAVYALGEDDAVDIDVFVPKETGWAFLDVVRQGHTMLTESLEVDAGQAHYSLPLDHTLTRDLVLSAFVVMPSGEIVRHSKMIYVAENSSLLIDIETDKEEYLPGDDAELELTVTGGDGQPLQSILGLTIVDEAVFALTESKPGLLQTFFKIQEALAQPEYQIAGCNFNIAALVAEASADDSEHVQTEATAAFAALDLQDTAFTATSAKDELITAKTKAAQALDQRGLEIMAAMVEGVDFTSITVDQYREYAEEDVIIFDFWGRAYEIDSWGSHFCYMDISLNSLGMDELPGTGDEWYGSYDLSDFVELDCDDYWDDEEWGWADCSAMDAGAWWGGAPDIPAGLPEEGEEGDKKSKVKVRKWFPETLYVNPAVITDSQGKATLGFPLADSITTWRVSALGSTKDGRLGGQDGSILVFQDFFIDIDFPASLTRNDEVTFPILIYNYLPQAQKVEIVLEEGDWFELYGPGAVEVVVEPDEVTSVSFPVKVTTAGWHTLTVYGLGEVMSDAMAKVTRVKPDGKQFQETRSGVLSDLPIAAEFTYPAGYIENSQGLVVKLIPGIVAQMVEGLDAMLSAPHG